MLESGPEIFAFHATSAVTATSPNSTAYESNTATLMVNAVTTLYSFIQ